MSKTEISRVHYQDSSILPITSVKLKLETSSVKDLKYLGTRWDKTKSQGAAALYSWDCPNIW